MLVEPKRPPLRLKECKHLRVEDRISGEVMVIGGVIAQRCREIGDLTMRLVSDEEGMSTAEYAIGTIAAAAFGALLYTVVTGDSVMTALTGIIGRALNTTTG